MHCMIDHPPLCNNAQLDTAGGAIASANVGAQEATHVSAKLLNSIPRAAAVAASASTWLHATWAKTQRRSSAQEARESLAFPKKSPNISSRAFHLPLGESQHES